ncbi:hypothetical protein QYS49_26645 [Marivirga salinae]|uniref:DNA polymerase III subunit gamma/tau n=1 Tax=Marivirga salinarum TaxID=3059078 RepID=A0AA49JGP4_9BACT|nr:hypothetical protein [Marivirga sp. BDSF4-3]WKK75145.1 hypothetical protein QYS49_26645 [Marivirga sp. BDSF4-3]
MDDNDNTEEGKQLNEGELKSAILEFIKNDKVGPVIENSLKNSVKLKGEMITVELTNPVEVDGIEKIKADLLTFIRKKFQNKAIQLQHQVNIEKAAERPYTPKEKFEAMLKENPILGKLRDTFGLDTDY